MALSHTVLNDVTKPCFLLSAAHALRPLLLLLCLVFVSGPALAGHLPVAPGSVFTLYDCEVNGCWSADTYSASSSNGAVPPAIVSKAQEWVRYRMQSRAAYLLEYWQRLYDPAYCCNVFIVWTDWSDPTCFPEDTNSPAHNGHAPYGHWIGCETQATGRYYPGWNPPVDYNSGVIHIDIPYDVFATMAVQCPVPDLKDKPTDACSVALEAGRGLPIPATACPTPSVMTDPKGEACLRDKLAVLGIPYSGPTATIRTAAYQAHLRDVWDRNEDHKNITDPAERQACAAKRAIVENERNTIHGLVYRPADESEHLTGKSFDISKTTADTLKATMQQAGRSVFGLLRSPPPCTLTWGGDYLISTPDPVHFELY